jgi:methanogenic corrinoid protein MtbC1
MPAADTAIPHHPPTPALFDVDAFVELLGTRDREGAIRTVREIAASGLDAETLIVGLLAPSQLAVGVRWEQGAWTVSDEHAATVIVDAAVDVLGLDAPAPTRGSLVVTCVEQEWHALPAKMFAEILRHRGWDVTLLGASAAADDLPEFLLDVGPTALVISCSISMNLLGAARIVGAAHAVQVPVLAGGRGIPSASRAAALGADGWAGGIDGADTLLAGWAERLPRLEDRLPFGYEESVRLDIASSRLVDEAINELTGRPTMVTFSDRQLARTRSDCAYILRFLGAAVLLDDEEVFTEFLQWLQDILARVGLPAVLGTSLEVLVPLLQDYPMAQRFVVASRKGWNDELLNAVSMA